MRVSMLTNTKRQLQQLSHLPSAVARFNLHFDVVGENKKMDAGRRIFLGAGLGIGLASALSSLAIARSARPLLLVLDIDTPGARKAFEDFKRLVDRKYESAAMRPDVRFAAVKDEEVEENRRALRQVLDALRPEIVLAANVGLARMTASFSLSIPILFFCTTDPIAFGLTDSLTRPNKGMTGFALGASADRKRREVLLRLNPTCKVMGLLSSKKHIGEGIKATRDYELDTLPGVRQVRFNCESLEEFRQLMNSAAARRLDAWDVAYVHVPFRYPEETVRLFNQLKKPVIYPRMKHVRMGGMAAFEPRIEEADEVWASQVASLLAGVPIENIPVAQATRYSFGLNLKACRRVGVEPSKSLLKIADLVIE